MIQTAGKLTTTVTSNRRFHPYQCITMSWCNILVYGILWYVCTLPPFVRCDKSDFDETELSIDDNHNQTGKLVANQIQCTDTFLSKQYNFSSSSRIPVCNGNDKHSNHSFKEAHHESVLNEVVDNNNMKKCRIYLAPTSIRGMTNAFGVYTTEAIGLNENILRDYNNHEYGTDSTKMSSGRKQFINLFDTYWWGRGVSDPVVHEVIQDIFDYQITFGSLPNTNCALHNIDSMTPNSTLFDWYENNGGPSNNPNAGSFTYYAGRNFFAEVCLSMNIVLLLQCNTFIVFRSKVSKNYLNCCRTYLHKSYPAIVLVFSEYN
jgi:hypothetical protein